MTEKTSIQRRYTLTIPRSIREKIHIEEGMELFWSVKKGRIILTPRSFKMFHERFPGKPKYETEKDKEEVEEVFMEESSVRLGSP